MKILEMDKIRIRNGNHAHIGEAVRYRAGDRCFTSRITGITKKDGLVLVDTSRGDTVEPSAIEYIVEGFRRM